MGLFDRKTTNTVATETNTQTTTTNTSNVKQTDQRVAADNAAIAVAPGGSLVQTSGLDAREYRLFGDLSKGFNDLSVRQLDQSADALAALRAQGAGILDTFGGIINRQLDQSSDALSILKAQNATSVDTLARIQDRTKLGDKSIFTDIFPFAAAAVVAIAIFGGKK